MTSHGDIASKAIENTGSLTDSPPRVDLQRTVETIEQKRARFNMVLEDLRANLENEPESVWPPYGAWSMLETLIDQGKFDDIEGKAVLDVGCGNGVIGIALREFGAKSVLLVDNNPEAVDLANRNIAKLEVRDARAIYSDIFSNVEGKFDIIIGNLPFNPTVEGVHIASKAERSNQNGPKGVGVVWAVVKDLEKYLVPETGRMLVSCSSRQGRIILSGIFNKFVRPGNWRELHSNEQQLTYQPSAKQALIADYIAPFLDYYNSETLRDDTIRYFYEDEEGNWGLHIHQEIGNDEGGYIDTTYVIPNYHKYPFLKNGFLAYKVTSELTTAGRSTKAEGITGREERPLDLRKIEALLEITAEADRKFTGIPHHLYYIVEGVVSHEQ